MFEPLSAPPRTTSNAQCYINVPQGRGARLELNSMAYNYGKIVGLHTQDFSICNIVVITSKSKIVMYHVDRISMLFFVESFIEEVKQVMDEPHAVFLIRKVAGAKTAGVIEAQLNKITPAIKLQTTIVGDDITGVILSFENNKVPNSLPGFSMYPGKIVPDNVVYHPDEERLISVRIIEGIIGKRAILATELFKACHPFVFDGKGWVVMSPHEFEIDTSHSLTQEEMNQFHPNDPYFTIVDNLLKFFTSKSSDLIYVGNDETEQAAKLTARHLENYLNSYDPYRIFRNNLLYLLNNISDTYLKPDEINWKSKLKVAISAMDQDFKLFLVIYEDFCKTLKPSAFKNQIIDNFDMLHHHLKVRLFHKTNNQDNQSARERANKFIKIGVALKQAQKNTGAKSLLDEAVREAIRGCLQSDVNLVGAHSHLASCLFSLGSFKEAIDHFNRAIDLYNRYFDKTESTKKKIETLQSGITACKLKIDEASSTAQQTALSTPMP